MFEGYLSHEQLLKLQKTAIQLGLANNRSALLAGVPTGFAAGMALSSAPASQLMMDLAQLNTTERLTDGSVPLVTWLRNAMLLASYSPQSSVFQEALDVAEGRRQTQEASAPLEARASRSTVLESSNHPSTHAPTEPVTPGGFELDNTQQRKFRKALLEAYPNKGSLEMMVSDRLGENLEAIVNTSQALEQVVFDLLKWASARGHLEPLLLGARASNPDNAKLFRFSQDLGLTSTDEKKSNLERLVSGNRTFVDVAKWRAGLTRMEWRVCKIELAGHDKGTGFLVGPDMLMTNHHVVEDVIAGRYKPSELRCRFDYKMSEAGNVISMGEVVSLAEDWLYDASPHSEMDLLPDPKPHEPGDNELDYAMLRLSERIGDMAVGDAAHGERRGWIALSGEPVNFSSHKMLAILQHPEGQALKLALGMDETIVVNEPGNRIRYTLPTLGGSSGSPVFSSDWQLLALHHSGDPKLDNPAYNEAIPIEKIAMREKVQEFLTDLADEE